MIPRVDLHTLKMPTEGGPTEETKPHVMIPRVDLHTLKMPTEGGPTEETKPHGMIPRVDLHKNASPTIPYSLSMKKMLVIQFSYMGTVRLAFFHIETVWS